MASFSSEIIGRNVVDVEGAMFGVVTDLRLAPTTGTITHVLVEHAPEIDPGTLAVEHAKRLGRGPSGRG